MNLRKTALATPAALAALALVGCGGGSDNNNQAAATSVQAGQTQTSKVLVDGVEIQKTTYRWYSVTDDKGSLSDQPLAKAADEANLPHVLITESIRTSGNSAAPANDELLAHRNTFYIKAHMYQNFDDGIIDMLGWI